MEWIDATERRPETTRLVIIYRTDAGQGWPADCIWLGYFDGDRWRNDDSFLCHVSHWQELPPPPPGIEIPEVKVCL